MMSEQCTQWFCAALLAIVLAIHPWAATGAAFGCCFFLARPGATSNWQRLKLGLFSFGAGYAGGVFWYGGGGPPWNERAMLVAAVISALASVTFTALYYVIDKNGPLPPWVNSILDRIPMLKRGGDQDGA